jgi:ABC-type transporter Mla subunit MlaD
MMRRLFQRFQSAYEPVLVLLIVGVAALLMYALYRATGGGAAAAEVSIVATFDDVTGIKERSKVLFKGMPVGTVRELKYDKATDGILVRLDIDNATDIPANIKPYLESSLFGEAHIVLKTDKDQVTDRLLVSVAGDSGRTIDELRRYEGEQISKAETIMPGIKTKADDALVKADKALVRVTELADITKGAITDFNKAVQTKVSGPVKECVDELQIILKGPEGQADKALAAELQRAVDSIQRHSDSLDTLFNGKPDGSAKGLITVVNDAGGNWESLVEEVTEGKDKALKELESVSKSLEEARKLGKASDKLGQASDSVKDLMDVIKLKPNSIVWGMNGQQKAMLEHKPVPRPTTGAGKK